MTPRLFATATVLFALTLNLVAGPRDDQWKKVEEAAKQNLPKTAITQLEPIIAGALADQNYAEATKAIARKITFEGQIQGSRPEEVVVRLEAEVAKAPPAMKPVMEAILAHWYWSYFQQNRWRFLQRTRTATSPGTDLQTWDLPRILDEIDRHFSLALADDASLKAMPIGAFEDLLEKGDVPDTYRPTLFDFLAYDALQFYQAGEQGAVQAENAFEIEADSPIFDSAGDFLKWQPVTTDPSSQLFKAIRLYQALLRFHSRDKDPSARLDADLARLVFGFNAAVGENKADRYEAALQRLVDHAGKHEIAARALALLGEQINRNGDPVKAHALARQGLDAFPETAGGAMCYNLIQEIEAKSAQVVTEFVWNAPWPSLHVTYRNVTKVYFRAVPVAFDDYLKKMRWGYGQFDDEQRSQLLAHKSALEWSADLPATTDFKTRTEHLPAPATLKPGFYAIFASHAPGFSRENNQLSVTPIWVSDLALVTQSWDEDRATRGFVLQAESGEPLAGATVRAWVLGNSGATLHATLTSDANGRFVLPPSDEQMVLVAEHHGQVVSSHQPSYNNVSMKVERTTVTTAFFTDRVLYRPGQTINYKGIRLRANHTKGKYSAVAQDAVEVVFNDTNGKEVSRAKHVTNDFGSFSGVFTAPRDRLPGYMSLQVAGDADGAASFSVEEYKRPKFEVEISAPAAAAKLDAAVELSGQAHSYTGAAIGGAKVKWHVVRESSLPSWCWWWQPRGVEAIAHGTAVTEPDGTFKIQFTATPDRTVPAKLEPVFYYNIHADVTDTTGETRSTDRSVAAGYTALQAVVTLDDWQTSGQPVEVAISTSSLDGAPQAVMGTLTIHALKQPTRVERAALFQPYWRTRVTEEPSVDPANPNSWEPGEVITKLSFETDTSGSTKVRAPLKAGIYRVSLATKDRFGKAVTTRQTLKVVESDSRKLALKLPNLFIAQKWSVEPGEKFVALWGTGYEAGRAFVELECDGQPLQGYWTASDRTQSRIELPVTEAMRGGFTVRVTSIRENRAYLNTEVVDVPWSNKALAVKWERFRSKLLPGQPETWTATVGAPDGKHSPAEMVATLYDASLDQFRAHVWPEGFGDFFRSEDESMNSIFQNSVVGLLPFEHNWDPERRFVEWSYRRFTGELATTQGEDTLVLSPFTVSGGKSEGYAAANTLAGTRLRTELKDVGSSISVVTKQFMNDSAAASADAPLNYNGLGNAPPSPPGNVPLGNRPDSHVNLDQVTARKNLNETAFFFPHLLTDKDGVVKLQFTMPEALTKWKFLGFAHDKELRAGLLTGETVTAKDLMVEPNPPRFVREGDTIEFTVKVSNQGDQPQSGRVRLTFADAATLDSADAALGNRTREQAFDVPAKQARTYSWRVTVPDGMGFLTYKAVGATNQASDGEEGFLPVLSRRILVTESLPLPIRGQTTKEFDFKKLLESGQSNTLRHQSLTVQMVSQPAWYAVMALPYLMEFPHECSEQLFSRLYANALARHIANSDPKIRRIFDLWRNTPALDSPLARNLDLKSVLLEETPWLRDANRESESRRNVGLLFDANRLDAETTRILGQLSDRQQADGLWSWFPGGPSSEYISLYITTGFGRLRHLGVELDPAAAVKSLAGLDAWMDRRYREIQRQLHPENYHPGYLDALYLYGRSFFLKDRPVAKEHQVALDFFLRKSREYWTGIGSRQSEAHLALALQRFGDPVTPQAIVKSLKERSVTSEELGMFWRDTESGWWWYQAPIETQAMMIEVLSEVAHDDRAVEDCKVWLLKQKQTQDWKTTKATADAVYGLLLRGTNLLSSDALVEVSLAGTRLQPEKVEAGTGFYEEKFTQEQIKPAMGRITVKKTDDGVSWGSVHWQYLEDMTKVTPHAGTPLTLKKSLWIKETTKKGPVLKPVSGPIGVGDELVVRIELRTDRDMEYIHLKDQRGSGTEPVNVLSQYKYQDGLGYYENTRDTASHFFIDYLPKGTHVFEYSTRVQLRGRYQSGIAEIQCMYAPEFNSHSESLTLDVQ